MHPLTFDSMKQLFHLNKASDRAFMANLMGGKKANDEPYEVADFMPVEESTDNDEYAGWDKICGQWDALAASSSGMKEE